jgi:hypothetical protein
MFLQKLWQDKLSWDKQLPHHIQQEWNKLQQTIPLLSQIRINRKIIQANATNIQIHGFCDSSEIAYSACLYIRSTNAKQHTSCDLLCSTSRVAPLKTLTIPRLELCAAILLAKLFRKAIRALNLTINEAYLWTDTSIVLTWIRTTEQVEDIRWKQSHIHSRRDSVSYMETCTYAIQRSWSNLTRHRPRYTSNF